MTAARQAQRAAQKQSQLSQPAGWKWPVDLSQYDCSSYLREQERLCLSELMQRQMFPPVLPPSLQGLLRPINDVLALSTQNPNMRRMVKRVLLVETHQRQKPLWAWTPEEWLEILCETGILFAKRYPTAKMCRQQVLTVAYLLCGFTEFHHLGAFVRKSLANVSFGMAHMEALIERVVEGTRRWGLTAQEDGSLYSMVREALLVNRSPYLEDLTYDLLLMMRERAEVYEAKRTLGTLSCALVALGIFDKTLPEVPLPARRRKADPPKQAGEEEEHIAPEWLQYCERWEATSTLAPSSRQRYSNILRKTGRWLTQEYSGYVQPEHWTREFAATFVAFVDQQRCGEWIKPGNEHKVVPGKMGQQVGPKYKMHCLVTLRTFFLDCQEWGWIPRRFDPRRALMAPRSIRTLVGPNPRVIRDDLWAKLLWAGLNLQEEDLSCWISTFGKDPARPEKRRVAYPVEMVRAMAIVWLFCGIRSDEWSRLRVGCIRWQREDVVIPGTNEILPKDAVCMLDIPTHKTGTAFTKPVDRVVGEAIEAWERIRPVQPPKVDPKTGEEAHFLFCYRGYRIWKGYINKVLIPTLCKKAGIPRKDARGNITSHRARSTIATQLFNAANPLSLFELQQWLGHRSISSTQQYAKISPTRLASSKAKAEYFERNLRLIDVLIDQDVVKSGAAAAGQPWRYYDLGHGLCTYDFFDTCPHRMACAKCSFYVPKGSSLEQILEGKANLLHMKQELSLTEEEMAAVDDGLTALDALQQRLADVSTPAGPTPRQLQAIS